MSFSNKLASRCLEGVLLMEAQSLNVNLLMTSLALLKIKWRTKMQGERWIF